jgi:hypothetical protein
MKNLLLFGAIMLMCITASIAQTLSLRPGPADGKDAEIFSCAPCGYNVRNFGKIAWFDAIAWTKDGNCSNARSLLRFDLSSIPQGATVISARLSLFFAYDAPDEEFHSNFPCNGTNAVVLQRITKPWSEDLVTWKTQPNTTTLHQVVVPGSHTPTQDYPNIDVRRMVQDWVNAPNKNFGFMMKLKAEKKFKKLLFASSDHPNPELRPLIRIVYTTSHTLAPPVNDGDQGSGNHGTPPLISDFHLTPNPAFRESIELSFYANSAFTAHVNITSIRGNTVYNKTLTVEQGQNDIWIAEAANWQRGIYIIKTTVNGQLYTAKFVIL